MFSIIVSSVVNIISSYLRFQIVWVGFVVGALLKYFNVSPLHFTHVPDMGILITMAIIGSHIDVTSLKKHYRSIIFIIMATILASVMSAIMIYEMLNINMLYAFIIASVLCLSSTIICQSVLYEHNTLSTDYGQLSIIGTIIQDIIGIMLLLYMHAVTSVIGNYTLTISIYMAILFVMIIAYKLDISCEDYDSTTYNKIFILMCICVYVISEYLDQFNIAKEFVFFAAGYIFRKVVNDFDHLLSAIQYITIASLFIFAGFNIDIISAAYNFRLILEVLVLIQLIKFILLYISLSIARSEKEIIVKTSLLLSVFTELTFFVVFLININAHIRDVIVIATVLSMIISTILFQLLDDLFTDARRRTIGIARYAAKMYINNLTDYVLLIGINKRSLLIMNTIAESFASAIIIDKQLEKVLHSNSSNCFFMDARIKETYEILNINIIKCIIVCTTNINDTIAICSTIRKINKNTVVYALCERYEVDRVVMIGNIKPIIVTTATNTDISDMLAAEIFSKN